VNATKQTVDEFLEQKTLALVGASATGKKFGNTLLKQLKAKGYKVLVVHPTATTIDGEPCSASIPSSAGGLVVCVHPTKTLKVVQEAHEAGIKRVWIPPASVSQDSLDFCAANGMTVLSRHCLLMFLEPVGFPHNVHRCICGLLGKMPA